MTGEAHIISALAPPGVSSISHLKHQTRQLEWLGLGARRMDRCRLLHPPPAPLSESMIVWIEPVPGRQGQTLLWPRSGCQPYSCQQVGSELREGTVTERTRIRPKIQWRCLRSFEAARRSDLGQARSIFGKALGEMPCLDSWNGASGQSSRSLPLRLLPGMNGISSVGINSDSPFVACPESSDKKVFRGHGQL